MLSIPAEKQQPPGVVVSLSSLGHQPQMGSVPLFSGNFTVLRLTVSYLVTPHTSLLPSPSFSDVLRTSLRTLQFPSPVQSTPKIHVEYGSFFSSRMPPPHPAITSRLDSWCGHLTVLPLPLMTLLHRAANMLFKNIN